MTTIRIRSIALLALVSALLIGGTRVWAHCDGLDGPVVTAARHALESGDVNRVLIWVRAENEAEIRAAFNETMTVRKLGPEAHALADRYFFETLVRVHRAGEGAPYTGLKPAGRPELAIAAADKALATGKLEPVAKLVSERMHQGLDKQFHEVASKKKYNPND